MTPSSLIYLSALAASLPLTFAHSGAGAAGRPLAYRSHEQAGAGSLHFSRSPSLSEYEEHLAQTPSKRTFQKRLRKRCKSGTDGQEDGQSSANSTSWTTGVSREPLQSYVSTTVEVVDVTITSTVHPGSTSSHMSSQHASQSTTAAGTTSESAPSESLKSASTTAASYSVAQSSASSNTKNASSTAATASAITSASSAVQCPSGSKYTLFTDDFNTLDGAKWTREVGSDNSSTFGTDGLLMTLSPDEQNIVYQSVAQWLPPTRMSVSVKTTNAPGIINCVIFKNADASDEIDLELIEGGWDVPLWKDGERLEFGRDVTGDLASSSINHTAWKYYDKSALPYDKVHEWTVNWENSTLDWSADSKSLLNLTHIATSQLWPTEALHVRFGPWVGGDWAGTVDWDKYPDPVQRIAKIEIEGCMAV